MSICDSDLEYMICNSDKLKDMRAKSDSLELQHYNKQ